MSTREAMTWVMMSLAVLQIVFSVIHIKGMMKVRKTMFRYELDRKRAMDKAEKATMVSFAIGIATLVAGWVLYVTK